MEMNVILGIISLVVAIVSAVFGIPASSKRFEYEKMLFQDVLENPDEIKAQYEKYAVREFICFIMFMVTAIYGVASLF